MLFRSNRTQRGLLALATLGATLLVALIAHSDRSHAASCRHPEGNQLIELFGDVNHSSSTNVADCLCVMLAALAEFASDPMPPCLAGAPPEADLNCDGHRTVEDVQVGVAIALAQGLPAAIDTLGDGCPDACDPCAPPSQGSCLIAGACVAEYGLKQAMACDWCDPSASAKSWTTASEMTPCSSEGHFCLGGVCLPGLPDPPTELHATPLHGRVSLTFTAPEVLPAVVITGYEVLVVESGTVVPAAGSPASVTGLHNGEAYTFRVRALTAAGASEWSAPSSPSTPQQCLGEPDGAVCDDGNACTQADTCQSEACVGADPVSCTAPETSCALPASCNPTSGACEAAPKADGLACTAQGGCPGTCSAGACAGFQVVSAQNSLSQCATSGTLSATPPTSGSGQWTLIGGTGSIAAPSQPSTPVTGLSTGPNVFRWTVTGDVCGQNYADVTITRPAPTPANAGGTQQLCQITDASLAANTPSVGTGTWSVVSGQATFADAASPSSAVSHLGAGDNVLRWTIDAGECGSTHADVTVRRFLQPEPTSAGANQLVCVANTTLAAAAADAGGGAWSVVSGSASIANTNSPTSAVSGLGAGPNVLRWTVTNGVCEPRVADVTITRELPPTTASTSPDKHVCGDETTISGSSPTSGSGAWSVVSGSANFSDAAAQSPTVTGMQVGANTLRWTISTPNCGASAADVTLTRYLVPTAANAGADQNLPPQQTETTLNANSPTTGAGVWSVIEGTGILADPTDPHTLVTNLSSGLNVFRWTIANGPCFSFSEVAIVRPMVCTGNRVAITQADIKNFRVCREITGNLTIESIPGLQNLSWLSNLLKVHGSVTIRTNPALTSLQGLDNLAEVGTTASHELYIGENNVLANLSALEQLRAVIGRLWINYNPVATALHLNSLEAVTVDLRVEGNALMSSFAIPSLLTVGRDLSVQRQPLLSQCALEAMVSPLSSIVAGAVVVADNLSIGGCNEVLVPAACARDFDVRRHAELRRLGLCTTVTGSVTLGNHNAIPTNQQFTSIAPLSNLQHVSGNFYIYYMYNIPTLQGLNALQTVGGWFRMHVGSHTTTMAGLDSLQTVAGYMYIDHNHSLRLENGDFPSLVSVGSHFQLWNNHPSGANYVFNAFPALTSIGGSFYFYNNYRIAEMAGFQALQSIGGYFLFDSNAQTSYLGGFGNLTTVSTYVQISNNHALTGLSGFPLLATVGTSFSVFSNNALAQISGFGALASLGGLLTIYSNTALAQISGFDVLNNLNGAVDIYTNPNLVSIGGFGVLPHVKGYLRLHNNAKLASVTGFSALNEVGSGTGHYLHVTSNPLLTNLGGLSSLEVVRGELLVRFNAALPSLAQLSNLKRTGGPLRVEENPALTELGLSSLGLGMGNGVVGPFTIFGNPALAQCDAYDLRDQVFAGGGAGITGPITILENEYDEVCPGVVPPVANCNTNHVINNAADLLALAGCSSISGHLTISGATVTNLAGLQNLTHLGGSLTVQSCPNLVHLGHLSSLQTVSGFVSILSNPALTSLAGLSSVQSIGGYLRVHNNAALTNFGLTSLTTIGQYLYIDSNNALVHITGIDALTSIGQYFYLLGNPNLETITGFSGLQTIGTNTGHYLQIQGNPKLQSLAGLENLHTINGYLYLHTNNALVNLGGLESLTSVSSDVRLYHNLGLTTLSGLDALETIGGYLRIDYNYALASLQGLGALESVGNYLMIHANSSGANGLQSLAGLDSLKLVAGMIYIESNGRMTSIGGLNALETVGSYMHIAHNHAMLSINGFASLQSVGAYLTVHNNNALQDLDGFDSLTAVGWNSAHNGTGRYLQFNANPALQTISGFQSLQTVGSYFRVTGNGNLLGMPGLASLTSVGGYVWIDNNAKLASLAGLSGLASIAGYFRVEANALLMTLGLASLAQVAGDFIVFNNASLPECLAYQLADAVGSGVSGVVTVGNNNTGATCP